MIHKKLSIWKDSIIVILVILCFVVLANISESETPPVLTLVATVETEIKPAWEWGMQPVTTSDQTPTITFNSDQTGTISYYGPCVSDTTIATIGDNTITYNTIEEGIHFDCGLVVTNETSGASNNLNIGYFVINLSPLLDETTPVQLATTDLTPSLTIDSTQAGSISYDGGCTSDNITAVAGQNTITFNTLQDLTTYDHCTITVTNDTNHASIPLLISQFYINIDPAWSAVDSSDDGTHIIAVANGGRMYISTDTGDTWTEKRPDGDIDNTWNAVASDSDGSLLFASIYGADLFISRDSGETWSKIHYLAEYPNWSSLSSSTDGSVLVAVNNYMVYVSHDSGMFWDETYPFGDPWVQNPGFDKIASDSTGTNLMLSTWNGELFISNDSGGMLTWRKIVQTPFENTNITALALNSDGTKMIIAGTSGMYLSVDNGITWNELLPNGITAQPYNSLSMSSDGNSILASVDGGRIYQSIDGGVSWRERQPAGDIDQRWGFTNSSSDGSLLMAGVMDGHLLYLISNENLSVVSNRADPNSPESQDLSWSTNIASSSQIAYGLTSEYGTLTPETNISPMVSNHSVRISGLTACTTYHYKTISKDIENNITESADQTFKTIGCVSSSSGNSSSGVSLIKSIIKTLPAVPTVPIELVKKAEAPTNNDSKKENTSNRASSSSSFSTGSVLKNPEILNVENQNKKIETIPEIKTEPKKIPIAKTAKIITEETTKIIGSTGGQIVTTTVASAGAISSISATVSLSAEVISFSDIVLIPMRVWGIIMTGLGIRKRRKHWGCVYDSTTKQPLDPAYVILQDMNGKEISSAITDMDGRYGFIAPIGKYKLIANKNNYLFPSTRVTGKVVDEIYGDLYFGGEIEITVEGGVITKNIPMDPLKFDWNEFEKNQKHMMKFFSKRSLIFAKITNILFNAGILLTLASVILVPKVYNIIIFVFYVLMFIARRTIIKPKSFGFIVEKETQNPISFAIINIKSANGQEINKVANKIGKFFCLIQNGTYKITIKKKNADESYTEIYKQDGFEVKDGVINEKFEI